MQTFEKKVKWTFTITCAGYGREVKSALKDACATYLRQIDDDLCESDLESIEKHQVVLIEPYDIDDEDEQN